MPLHPFDFMKPMNLGNQYLEAEVQMRRLAGVGNAAKVDGGLLIFPGGMAKAIVPVPKHFRRAFHLSAHSTSTFARCGIDILDTQRGFQNQLTRKSLRQTMEVYLSNRSPHPVLVREGDPCRLLNSSEINAKSVHPSVLQVEPETQTGKVVVHLHAGNQVLVPNPRKFPTLELPGGTIRYIDPRLGVSEQFKTKPFTRLKVKRGEYVVISTAEQVEVPNGHVAFVHSANNDLMHSTATLVHPGWKGNLALEFMSLRRGVITPGNHVAYLTAHSTPQAPNYAGRYQSQKEVRPK